VYHAIRSAQLEIANVIRIVERPCQFCRVSSPLTIYILVLSGFIGTRGVQTPQLEDIPGYVRLYEERLLGKRAILVTNVHFTCARMRGAPDTYVHRRAYNFSSEGIPVSVKKRDEMRQ